MLGSLVVFLIRLWLVRICLISVEFVCGMLRMKIGLGVVYFWLWCVLSKLGVSSVILWLMNVVVLLVLYVICVW